MEPKLAKLSSLGRRRRRVLFSSLLSLQASQSYFWNKLCGQKSLHNTISRPAGSLGAGSLSRYKDIRLWQAFFHCHNRRLLLLPFLSFSFLIPISTSPEIFRWQISLSHEAAAAALNSCHEARMAIRSRTCGN